MLPGLSVEVVCLWLLGMCTGLAAGGGWLQQMMHARAHGPVTMVLCMTKVQRPAEALAACTHLAGRSCALLVRRAGQRMGHGSGVGGVGGADDRAEAHVSILGAGGRGGGLR